MKIGLIIILLLSDGLLKDAIKISGYIERITKKEIIISNEYTFSQEFGVLRRATPKQYWYIPKDKIIYYKLLNIDGLDVSININNE